MIRQASFNRVPSQRLVLALVACLVPLVGFAASVPSVLQPSSPLTPALPEISLHLGNQAYTLEHATTPEQSAQGLMHRTSLPENHGMLFSFPSPGPVAFWMKNTLIPLDMLFLRQGKVVYIQDDAQPCLQPSGAMPKPCPAYGPGGAVPVDSVIELPAGTVKAHKLSVGLIVPELARAASFSDVGTPASNAATGLPRSFSGTNSVLKGGAR
jgi:uncharacterized protein